MFVTYHTESFNRQNAREWSRFSGQQPLVHEWNKSMAELGGIKNSHVLDHNGLRHVTPTPPCLLTVPGRRLYDAVDLCPRVVSQLSVRRCAWIMHKIRKQGAGCSREWKGKREKGGEGGGGDARLARVRDLYSPPSPHTLPPSACSFLPALQILSMPVILSIN